MNEEDAPLCICRRVIDNARGAFTGTYAGSNGENEDAMWFVGRLGALSLFHILLGSLNPHALRSDNHSDLHLSSEISGELQGCQWSAWSRQISVTIEYLLELLHITPSFVWFMQAQVGTQGLFVPQGGPMENAGVEGGLTRVKQMARLGSQIAAASRSVARG
jgi:hypothetical protein